MFKLKSNPALLAALEDIIPNLPNWEITDNFVHALITTHFSSGTDLYKGLNLLSLIWKIDQRLLEKQWYNTNKMITVTSRYFKHYEFDPTLYFLLTDEDAWFNSRWFNNVTTIVFAAAVAYVLSKLW